GPAGWPAIGPSASLSWRWPPGPGRCREASKVLREEQIDIRRKRARAGRFTIEKLGPKRVFSDFAVTNPATGGRYTVGVRGFEVGDNTCTCPDFKANTLGTCKHIEAVLESLKDEVPPHVRQRK